MDGAGPAGLGRVLKRLMDVAVTCDAVDMEQALWDVHVAAKWRLDLGDIGKCVAKKSPELVTFPYRIKYAFNPHSQKCCIKHCL